MRLRHLHSRRREGYTVSRSHLSSKVIRLKHPARIRAARQARVKRSSENTTIAARLFPKKKYITNKNSLKASVLKLKIRREALFLSFGKLMIKYDKKRT